MSREEVAIATADGVCPTSVFTPSSGDGPWPAVIYFMDGFGVRAALFAMAQRLADAGYVVVLPDLFYRNGPYGPLDPPTVLGSSDPMAILMPLITSTDNHRAGADTTALLDYLDGRADVRVDRVGATGYCMGGAMALTAAAMHPDRIGAVASFHGGQLAGDDALSPHLLVDKLAARVYIGAADKDDYYPPQMAAKLCEALMTASVDHRHELYAGAMHGWTIPDFPTHSEAHAERHWHELLGLFDATLA